MHVHSKQVGLNSKFVIRSTFSNVCFLSQISDLQNSLSDERVKNKLSDEYLRNAQDNVRFKLVLYF